MGKKHSNVKLKSELIYLLKEEKITGGGKRNDGLTKWQLRLISWNDQRPVIEKRQIRLNERDGSWFPHKNAGLKEEDIDLIVKNIDRLKKFWSEWDKRKSTEQEDKKDDKI